MTQICPKCRTVRPADTTAPDWQCPACGIAYVKAGGGPAMPLREATARSYAGNQSSFPWSRLIAAFFIIAGIWAGYHQFKQRSGGQPRSIASYFSDSYNMEEVAALAASAKPEDIQLFTAPWCPSSTRAKIWLAQAGFKYEECDIDSSGECASQLQELGSKGVPFLIVKGQHLKDGFDSDEFLEAIARK